MAGDSTSTTTTAAEGQAPAAAQPEVAKRLADLETELAAVRKEAAEKRVKAKEAEERAAAEAKKSAEEKGEWSKVIEIHKNESAALAKQLAEAQKALESVQPYAAWGKSEFETLKAQAKPEHLAAVEGLAEYRAVPILRQFLASTAPAAPAPAKSTTAAAPAAVGAQINWSALSAAQQQEQLRKLSPEQRKALAVELGVIPARSTIY